MTYRTGEKYIGSFYIDYIHGKGTFNYLNGDVYKGNFNMGIRQG